ncbi:MAG: RIP metalloprotease RseP, partial [Planctomycetes bacterium]|nr:RIP metalloprotease RseP [Planctomycetota bacterium]
PDSPAYLAGLRSGDEIVAAEINGELLSGLPPDPLLSAVANAVTYVGHRPLRLQVRRGADELWVTLQPRKSDDQETISRVQILSPFPGEPYSGTTVKAIAPGSRAMEVFATGDRVLSIAGQPAGSLHPLALMGRFTEESLEIEVETMSGQRRAFSVPRKDLLLWSLLGDVQWLDVGARIGRLSEDSPLRVAGLEEEDVIAAVGEQRVYSPKEARSELVKSDSAARSMRVLRSGSWITISWTPPDAQADLGVEWSSFAPIACVVPGGAADQAGITSGSRIVEVNGERVVDYEKQFYEEVTESAPGSELEMAWIDPAGVRRHARLTIGAEVHADPGLTIGKRTKTVKVSILESFGVGFQRTVFFGKQVFLTLRSLLRREVSPKNLAGPVGITDILTRAAQLGLVQLVYFMALISVNLGILNLLPFPILDGGHLLFLAIEKIKGSPVNVRVQEWATSIAFFLIISFAIFVTFHDVRRLFFWR